MYIGANGSLTGRSWLPSPRTTTYTAIVFSFAPLFTYTTLDIIQAVTYSDVSTVNKILACKILFFAAWSLSMVFLFGYFGSRLVRVLQAHLSTMHRERQAAQQSLSNNTSQNNGQPHSSTPNPQSNNNNNNPQQPSFKSLELAAHIRRVELGIVRIQGFKIVMQIGFVIFFLAMGFYAVRRREVHEGPQWLQYTLLVALNYSAALLAMVIHVSA
jgi:hypothetical protein